MTVSVYFDPHDLWIGVYWHRRDPWARKPPAVYVFLIPTVVIRFRGRP